MKKRKLSGMQLQLFHFSYPAHHHYHVLICQWCSVVYTVGTNAYMFTNTHVSIYTCKHAHRRKHIYIWINCICTYKHIRILNLFEQFHKLGIICVHNNDCCVQFSQVSNNKRNFSKSPIHAHTSNEFSFSDIRYFFYLRMRDTKKMNALRGPLPCSIMLPTHCCMLWSFKHCLQWYGNCSWHQSGWATCVWRYCNSAWNILLGPMYDFHGMSFRFTFNSNSTVPFNAIHESEPVFHHRAE